MTAFLSEELEAQRDGFRSFVNREIVPRAEQFDREETIPREIIERVAAAGYLRPAKSLTAWGLLNEEMGRGCSSVRSLLTVHGMVSHAILRWAGVDVREHWLPRLASGDTLAAFALSEANAGSDAQAIETTARAVDGGFVLDGLKKWISFGQIAGLFLVFARYDDRPAAFLAERNSPGLEIIPVKGLLGLRGSLVAEVRLEGCRVPREALVGTAGFGLSHVAGSCLDLGRYSVAWGCVGIAQGALEASARYAAERKQSGAALKDHQLIRRMLTNMIVDVRAARLLCLEAGQMKDSGDPRSIVQTMIAKYFSSRAAARAARDAVQIHGANGCTSEYPVARYFRDAKIMEIIEGSDEIQQLAIAEHGLEL